MTTLVRQAENTFLPRLTSGFGDKNTALYVQQQLLGNDPLDRFGRRVFGTELEFLSDADVTGLTSVDDAGTGTNAFQDAARGVYDVKTAAADNDYHAMKSDNQTFLFAAGKPLWFEAIFKLTEASSSQSAFWMGLTDTVTTGGFQANAAGPLASYDGALWFKNEDGTTLNFESSNAGTQSTKADIVTFPSGVWCRLGFYFDGSATTSSITPYYDVSGGLWNLTKGPATTIALAGLAEMNFVFGVKSKGSAETLSMDYLRVAQVR